MAEKISVRKTRRLRTLLAKHYKMPDPPEPKDSRLDQIVMTVLWQDVPPARAGAAYVHLTEEFVDWNELRVTVTSEVSQILESCGLPGRKGAILKRILSRAIEALFSFNFDPLAELPREELRDWFLRIEGVPHHVAAYILYTVYDYDRVLVGDEVARVIRRLGLVSKSASPAEIEPALNAVIPAKEAVQTWNALRLHATTVCTEKDFDCRKCLLRGECDTGKRTIAEMAAAAKAARQAAAKAARQAARKKKARKAAKKQTKKATKKKTTRKATTSKTRKKPAAKPKRKATRKKASRPKTSKKKVSKKKPKR